MRTTALDLVGDHSRPNYEYVRPDYENHWSDNWLAPVPGLWDDGNRQHSEPNLLDLALPFLQGGCDDLQPPSSVPTRNVGFGKLDHNPAPEGEILQPDNHGGKCQSSQINCAHEPTNPGKSIRNFREIEMDEEEGLQSLPQSVHGDEVSEPNNHKRKCRSYPSNYPSKTSKHVKLRVSFKVSEFFVEIPETVTVSFLKKTIMEKAIAIVGGGEHVDLLVRGKKIIDEIKILSETGISHESRLDVILEPKPLTRYSPAAAVVHQGTHDASTDPLFCNLDNKIREDHEVTESQTDILVGKNATSREDVEALDTGPMHQTINSSKTAQRRKSEFFSVSEVETLVQEVEKLGTGRWQKIKEEAFGNVSNRTHMDLKDKWRSLVKTAHRPANKRRGAVIPQAILDRVLAIETHNSQQEAMQRFTEFSNSINGFEFDEDTISPTFDQSETFAKKFKFKDDPVDLNFLDCPSVPPDPNPVLISLRLSGSSELDSPDDGDLSDDVFKYINSMLMEENMEPKPSMFHDPLALKAIEKSLYDVIGEKYLDSPNQPFFT